MHKSRVAVIVIDSENVPVKTAAEFWSNALGYQASEQQSNDNYLQLKTTDNEMQVLLQCVDHPSRVHLDIETNDIEAEVSRLEKLGAKRIAQIHTWWVMQAPTGHRFCVVKPQRSDFEENANVWQ